MTTSSRTPPSVPVNTAAETLLGRRAYSARGLLDKLREKGYSESEAAKAVQRLAYLGYLNDEAYAHALAASLKRRGYGARRVKQTLRHKGVDAETAEQAGEVQTGAEDESIDQWLRKLSKDRPLDARERARLFGALFRRGFEGDAIQRGLRRLQNRFGDCEWYECDYKEDGL